ncbi:MAG: hypothetical protein WEE89_07045 [Gemmatimonadota bacterium]
MHTVSHSERLTARATHHEDARIWPLCERRKGHLARITPSKRLVDQCDRRGVTIRGRPGTVGWTDVMCGDRRENDRRGYRIAPHAEPSWSLGNILNRYDLRLHFLERGRYLIMATKPMSIYSADDVLRIPIPPNLSGYELVDRVLEPVTPVGLNHGRIAGRVYKQLDAHVVHTRTPGVLPGLRIPLNELFDTFDT